MKTCLAKIAKWKESTDRHVGEITFKSTCGTGRLVLIYGSTVQIANDLYENGEDALAERVERDNEDGEVAVLQWLEVSASRRGRGVGSALLTSVIEQAREIGLKALYGRVSPEVGHSVASLFRFYQRHGFKVVARDDRPSIRLVL